MAARQRLQTRGNLQGVRATPPAYPTCQDHNPPGAYEGRNGRLSLFHHGQGKLSDKRLQSLTVVHNYLVKRADGTTAAERLFGTKPPELFDWLLKHLPDLPRPAAKRAKQPANTAPHAV